jgi:pimeloyl-ACP methyl ester carboxylesterase
MTSSSALPLGLHFVTDSPVKGLAVSECRVENPEATLICVHGGLDRGGSFARLARRIEYFDVVAYDRRGYQGSRALAPLDLEHHIDDLVALARREAAKGPVILFGHSFGGVVTLGAALREPSLVDFVSVYEAPLPWVLYRESSRPHLSEDAGDEAERFFRRMVSNGAWERLSEMEKNSRRLDGPALLSDLGLLRSGSKPFDLSQLSTPTLYAHGDALFVEYYRALCRDLEVLSPFISSYELANAPHGAHLANPDQLAALLQETWRARCA